MKFASATMIECQHYCLFHQFCNISHFCLSAALLYLLFLTITPWCVIKLVKSFHKIVNWPHCALFSYYSALVNQIIIVICLHSDTQSRLFSTESKMCDLVALLDGLFYWLTCTIQCVDVYINRVLDGCQVQNFIRLNFVSLKTTCIATICYYLLILVEGVLL